MRHPNEYCSRINEVFIMEIVPGSDSGIPSCAKFMHVPLAHQQAHVFGVYSINHNDTELSSADTRGV